MEEGGGPAGVNEPLDEGGGPAGVVEGIDAPNEKPLPAWFDLLSGVDGGLDENGTSKLIVAFCERIQSFSSADCAQGLKLDMRS